MNSHHNTNIYIVDNQVFKTNINSLYTNITIVYSTRTNITNVHMSSEYSADYSIDNGISNVHVSSAHICDYMTTTNLVYTTLTKIHSSRIRTINVDHPCMTTAKKNPACVAKQLSNNPLRSQAFCLDKIGNLETYQLPFLSINVRGFRNKLTNP